MRKRGQMEMIGLVVIVILITLGMLFLAQFALKDSGEKKIFTRKGLAYSTVSAIMKTTVVDGLCIRRSDGGQTNPQIGKDLLEDCAQNHDVPFLSTYKCDQKPSCEFLQEFVPKQLNESLGTWGKRYSFEANLHPFGDGEPVKLLEDHSRGGCPRGVERDTSGPFPLKADRGDIQTILYICE